MKHQMCSRCGERPAVVFIQKMEGDKVTPEGLCIKCARELNIGSINQIIDKMGISEEDLPRIFERNYTGVRGRTDKKASGIGLYLCSRICKNLNHEISAESEVGRGTKIKINLETKKTRIE